MRVPRIAVVASLLVVFALSAFAQSPAAGRWQCTSTDVNGNKTDWTIVIREDAGALSGYVEGHDYRLELVDPKFDGGRLTFQVSINKQPYKFETTVRGDKLKGRFDGPEASGTLEGGKIR